MNRTTMMIRLPDVIEAIHFLQSSHCFLLVLLRSQVCHPGNPPANVKQKALFYSRKLL